MKKSYFSFRLKKMAMISLIALLSTAPKAFSQWNIWDGMDLNSLSPTLFNTTHNGDGTVPTKVPSVYFCDVVPDSTQGVTSNSVLKYHFTNSSASSSENINHNMASIPNGATVLMRIKGVSDYGEIFHFEMKNQFYRLRARLKKSTIGDDYAESEANKGTGVLKQTLNWPRDFNVYENYQLVRISAGPTSYSVYLNENPTPIYTAYFTGSTTGSKNFWFGKSSSSSSMGSYIDWVLWDESGAFAPGEGQALPSALTKSNSTRLSVAQINGVEIPQFNRDTMVYNIGVAHGTAVPVVTGTPGHQFLGATFTVTPATSIPGSATITVKAADGFTPDRAYTINFLDGLAADAALKSAKVGSTTVAGFLPEKTTYDVKIASGSTTPELMTFTTNERYATAVVTDASALPGVATILVTAQDGSTTKTYTFNMSVADNTDASLTELKVNNVLIPGFDPATLTYDVVLPYGTTAIPSVSYSRTDPNSLAKTTRTDALALPGATTVLVTAADLLTTKTYTINFTVSTTPPSGIKNLSSADVSIYSVSKSSVTVRVPESMVNGMLYVYGINGMLKSKMKLDNTNVALDINNLASGIYAVKLVGRDGMTVIKKLVK